MNNRFGFYGVLGGIALALLLNVLSGCAGSWQTQARVAPSYPSADEMEEAEQEFATRICLGARGDRAVLYCAAHYAPVRVLVLPTTEIVGRVQAPAQRRLARFVTGERTVEREGDATIVVEPGTLTIYN